MYFNKFPKIDYKFSNNQTLPVVDIFRKVSFSQESLQNSNIFINIVNGEGKKAEIGHQIIPQPNQGGINAHQPRGWNMTQSGHAFPYIGQGLSNLGRNRHQATQGSPKHNHRCHSQQKSHQKTF